MSGCNTGYADGQWNLPSGKLEEGKTSSWQ